MSNHGPESPRGHLCPPERVVVSAPRAWRRPPSTGRTSIWVAGVLALASTQPVPGQDTPPSRPNIVVIMADDMGFGDLSRHGARDLATPNIDALARQSVRLGQFYANGPLCRPTRAALMTGRYPHRLRFEGNDDPLRDHAPGLPSTELALPELLRDGGYATALVGKWHLGTDPTYHPLAHGFDEFFGVLRSGIDYYTHRNPDGQLDLWEGRRTVEREGHLTEILAERAAATVGRLPGPFFLFVAFNAACPPFQPPGRAPNERGRGHAERQDYCAMVEGLDRGVGRILEALERRGIADETLVVYTHDHGGEGLSRNEPFAHGIGTLWEGGIRVPCFLRWPGRLPANRDSPQVALTMDLTATVLAAAEVEPPGDHPLDGVDLLPVLRGDAPPTDRTVFWRVATRHNRHKAVRRGDSKLLVAGAAQHLFDLAEDPGEKRDISAERPAEKAELLAALGRWEKGLVDAARRRIPTEREQLNVLREERSADDPELQQARLNLASSLQLAGNDYAAMALEEEFLVASSESETPHTYERAALSRVSRKKQAIGDWAGALALEERGYAADAAGLGESDGNLRTYAQRLANMRHRLGDLEGALQLRQRVHANQARFMPETNVHQQDLGLEIAQLHRDLGAPQLAAPIEEHIYELRAEALPADHPRLQAARESTARTRYLLGDWPGALELQRAHLAVLQRSLDPGHPAVLRDQQALAATLHRSGDTQAAIDLLRGIVAQRAVFQAEDDPQLQYARLALLGTELALGAEDADVGIAAYLRGWQLTLVRSAPTELVRRTRGLRRPFDLCVDRLVDRGGSVPWAAQLLLVLEATRGAEIVAARDIPATLTDQAEQLRAVHAQRTAAGARIARIAGRAVRTTAQRDRLRAAVKGRALAEGRIAALRQALGALPWDSLGAGALAETLPPGVAAASLVRFGRDGGNDASAEHVAALVLQRDGSIRGLDLGLAHALEQHVADAHRAIAADDPTTLVRIRRRLVEPITGAIPEVETLWLSQDGSLPPIPWSALLLAQPESPLQVRPVVSLVEFLLEAPDSERATGFVAFGGLDGQRADAASPTLFPRARAVPDRRGTLFPSLGDSAELVQQLKAAFDAAHPNAGGEVAVGSSATKARLRELAATARYLHLGTALYAAPSAIRSAWDRRPAEPVRPLLPAPRPGFAPELLAGIALSGANAAPDLFARRPGLATAEELGRLDLACELVTLSGVTALPGQHRAWESLALLRRHFHAAGARYVLTSLWLAPEESTRLLLSDLYQRLVGTSAGDAHDALRGAQAAARDRGVPLSEWGGWALTGR